MQKDKTGELMRAEFEAWFSEVPLLRSGDGYKFMSAQHAWNVWQSAQYSLITHLNSEIESSWGRFRIELKGLGISTSSHIYQAYKSSFMRVTTRLKSIKKEFK